MWRMVPTVVLLSAVAFAQSPSPSVGRRVVTKRWTPLRAGARVVDDGQEFRVYEVDRSEGDWLLLKAGRITGWVRSEEVIPFDQAIDFYTQMIESDPGAAAIYVKRGSIWAEEGELDIAIADYGDAIRIDPRLGAAYYNRAMTWAQKGEYDRAIADYNEFIRLDPKKSWAFNNRGNAWLNKREL